MNPQPQAPEPIADPTMGLHPEELKRLSRHIEGCIRDARADHERRLRMFDRYKQLFLNIAKDVSPKEGGSQYVVPLLRWVALLQESVGFSALPRPRAWVSTGLICRARSACVVAASRATPTRKNSSSQSRPGK